MMPLHCTAPTALSAASVIDGASDWSLLTMMTVLTSLNDLLSFFPRRALEQLNYLGALDDEGTMTDLGRWVVWL